MNWSEIQGEWQLVKGLIRQRWNRLTDDDLLAINGERDLLIGRIQERYLLNKELAERQVRDLERLFLRDAGSSLS